MKVKIKIEQEVEIKTLEVKANARYWEDATIDGVEDTEGKLTPCRVGDLFCPIIDIETGIITNWKQGVKANIHFKVCDEGSYYLKDAEGKTILSIEDNYAPSILCPKDNGYGDYIILDIDENGKIDGWKADLSSFTEDED